jgi:hypothetical protein
MNDDDRLDTLMASMSPVTDAQVADLPLAGLERDLLEAIMSEAPAGLTAPRDGDRRPLDRPSNADAQAGDRSSEPPLLLGPVARAARRPPRPVLIGAIGAAAVIAVVVAAFASRQPRSDPSVQADDPSVQVDGSPVDAGPGALPQLVVDLPGWHMDSIESYNETEGNMVFVDSRPDTMIGISVEWAPASKHEGEGTNEEVLPSRQVTGVEAVVSRSTHVVGDGPSGELHPYEATWTLDGFSLRAHGAYGSEDEFFEMLTALRRVEREPWLDTVPPNVVWPGDQSVTDAMLVDIPLPPGFDPATLVSNLVRSREAVRGEVAQAVACGWVESWIAATDAGDAAGVQRAVDVMAASGDWPIVKEPDPEADQLNGQLRQLKYDSIRTIADAMPTDAVIPLDGGQGMKVRELYANWLNCHH